MNKNEIIKIENIQNKILTIRNAQVMLDNDLSEFYGVETRVLNQAVKRNIERFPEEFCFQLSKNEFELLRSQIATLKNSTDNLRSQNATSNLKSQSVISSFDYGGRRSKPFVFTEQGVAMLSAVLKSESAVKMSIQIINAFVSMRHFLISNANVFSRLDSLEIKQFNTDNKFDHSHDRFLIIDENVVYHIGASLKDLGKKWFAFSKMSIDTFNILSKLKENS
ncbi:MAG: ORF6N domain-containing protein [Bacteroidota bacterium]